MKATPQTPKVRAASKSAPRPLTITIDGELAATIRGEAKTLGFKPAALAKIMLAQGEAATAPDAAEQPAVKLAGGVAVRPFIVPTKWVEITVKIEHDLVAKFHTARDAKRNRLRLPTGLISNIVSLYERTGNKGPGWHDWQLEALGRSMTGGRGKKLVPVSINLREVEWERIIECSKAMDVEPVAMLRALFSRMVRDL